MTDSRAAYAYRLTEWKREDGSKIPGTEAGIEELTARVRTLEEKLEERKPSWT